MYFPHLLACIFCKKHLLINFWFLHSCCCIYIYFFERRYRPERNLDPANFWTHLSKYSEVSSCLLFLPLPVNSADDSGSALNFQNALFASSLLVSSFLWIKYFVFTLNLFDSKIITVAKILCCCCVAYENIV